MVADPLLLKAGSWLAIAGGVLLVLTVLAEATKDLRSGEVTLVSPATGRTRN